MDLEASLDRVRVLRSSKIPVQARQANLLGAVESALTENNESPTSTAYFAAMLSLLDRPDAAEPATALLSYIVPHVPRLLLASKIDVAVAKLLPVLLNDNKDSDTSLIRASIGVLEAMLISVDASSWQVPLSELGAQRTFSGVLGLAQDSRPKIRKRAIEAVENILTDGQSGNAGIKIAVNSALTSLAESPANDTKLLHHSLQLLKAVVASAQRALSTKQLDEITSALLKVSRVSDNFVILAAFEVFGAFFSSSAQEPSVPLISDLLLGLSPAPTDKQVAPAWFALVAQAYTAWDSKLKLHQVFDVVTPYLASPPASDEVAYSAGQCLVALISEVVAPNAADLGFVHSLASDSLFPLLQVQYHASWSIVCEVCAAFIAILPFEVAPRSEGVKNIVRVVGALRGNLGDRSADQVIGAGIKILGPEVICEELVPLQLDPQAGTGRVWLLPLLAEHVVHTKLGYFFEKLAPLADEFDSLAEDLPQSRRSKIVATVAEQLWSLFPRFCDECVDTKETFASPERIESVLGWIYSRPAMRSSVCLGLRLLLQTSVEAGATEFIAKQYGTNILKVLLNAYQAMDVSSRGFVLDTVEVYLAVLPQAEVVQLFNQVSNMLAQNLKNSETSHTMMDIINALAPHLEGDAETTNTFVNLFKTVAGMPDALMQKKAYSTMTRFISANVDNIQSSTDALSSLILELQSSVGPNARRTRLQAIASVASALPENGDYSFLFRTLPEAILTTKDPNEKTREAAFNVLVLYGNLMSKGSGVVDHAQIPELADNEKAAVNITEYFEMVMAGLAGSTPHMIAATTTSLSRILFEYADQLPADKLEEYIELVWMLLESPSREIITAVLGFVKVSVVVMPIEQLQRHLSRLLSGLLAWSAEHKNHFKSKVRHLIERLLRRCGYDAVAAAFPEKDMKLLQNIHKSKERAKRKRASGTGAAASAASSSATATRKFDNEFDEALYGSSSDDSDATDDEKADRQESRDKISNKKKGAGREMYLIDGNEEPLDLLDHKAMSRISSSRPQKTPDRKVKHQFPQSKDGKIVIGHDTSRDEHEIAKKDALAAYMDAVSSGPVRTQQGKLKFKRGRRGQVDAGERDRDDDDLEDHDKTSMRPKLRGSKVGKSKHTPKGNLKQHMQKRRRL